MITLKQNLIKEIEQKENDLNSLKEQDNKVIERQKENILKSKSLGMTKSLYLLGFTFESSCSRTTQYLEFHRIFKREFSNLLKPYCSEIDIHKPNHFDLTGFFKLNDGRIFYLSIGDLRWSKENMLIRTAKDFKDYTGGSNGSINLNKDFEKNLFRYLNIKN